MPGDQLDVALQALRHDAGLWRENAEVTRTAAEAMPGLTLTIAEMSWAAEGELLANYDTLRLKVERLLNEATWAFDGLAHTLDVVAYNYERSDTEAAAIYDNLWEPVQ
ncbi:hypothetical protein ABGB07_27960 [Micromonosporaceae bacterium B7E4]